MENVWEMHPKPVLNTCSLRCRGVLFKIMAGKNNWIGMRKLPVLCAVAVATVIAAGSLTPVAATGTGSGAPWLSYMLHVAAYAALAAFLVLSWGWSRLRYVHAVLTATAYGVLMELLQVPVPGRFFSLFDIMANTGGAAAIGFNHWFPVLSWLRNRF